MQGLRPLYRYFDFAGRSGRAEFWQFIAIYVVVLLLAGLIDLALSTDDVPAFTLIVIPGALSPAWAVSFRRLHDRGYSGWWATAQLAVGILAFLIGRAANLNAYTSTGDFLTALARIVLVAQLILNIFLLVQLARAGDPGDNRFGPPPSYDDPAPTLGDIAMKVRAQAQPALQPSTSAMPPAAPVTGRRPAGVDSDPLEQIERLAKLRDAGMLTDAEFQAQKASLLTRL